MQFQLWKWIFCHSHRGYIPTSGGYHHSTYKDDLNCSFFFVFLQGLNMLFIRTQFISRFFFQGYLPIRFYIIFPWISIDSESDIGFLGHLWAFGSLSLAASPGEDHGGWHFMYLSKIVAFKLCRTAIYIYIWYNNI